MADADKPAASAHPYRGAGSEDARVVLVGTSGTNRARLEIGPTTVRWHTTVRRTFSNAVGEHTEFALHDIVAYRLSAEPILDRRAWARLITIAVVATVLAQLSVVWLNGIGNLVIALMLCLPAVAGLSKAAFLPDSTLLVQTANRVFTMRGGRALLRASRAAIEYIRREHPAALCTEPSTGGAASREACSFCGHSKAAVKCLVSNGERLICDECIGHCNDILLDEEPEWKHGTPYPRPVTIWPKIHCAFCRGNQAAKMIRSDFAVHICDACVVLCNDIIVEQAAGAPAEPDASAAP